LKSLQEALVEIPIENHWCVTDSKLTFELATTRHAEQMLRDQFPHRAPSDQTRGEWFLFAAHCFELMIMTTALKIEFYRVQMVRQIVDQNLIGIAACMRSLLEHVAISEWLLERLKNQWDMLQKRTQSIGIAGTMGTVENTAPWAEF
jgi:hypothetical protein